MQMFENWNKKTKQKTPVTQEAKSDTHTLKKH